MKPHLTWTEERGWHVDPEWIRKDHEWRWYVENCICSELDYRHGTADKIQSNFRKYWAERGCYVMT